MPASFRSQFPGHPARIPHGYDIRRYVFGDDAPRANRRVVADADTGEHDHPAAQPHIISHTDRKGAGAVAGGVSGVRRRRDDTFRRHRLTK